MGGGIPSQNRTVQNSMLPGALRTLLSRLPGDVYVHSARMRKMANLMPRSFNKFLCICAAVLLVVCAMIAWWWSDRDVIRLDQNDPRVLAEHKQLNGRWLFERSNYDRPFLLYITLSDGEYTQRDSIFDEPPHVCRYRLDPTTEPKKMDTIGEDNVLYKGI
jgi:hypothetical protein